MRLCTQHPAPAALTSLPLLPLYSLVATLFHPFPLHQSLRTSKKEHALESRLRALTEQITSDVYAYVCTGLFEAHKLLFSFQLAVKVLECGPRALDTQVGGAGAVA